MKLKQELIDKLRRGEVQIKHTQKPEDLELLKDIMIEAETVNEPHGNHIYYTVANMDNSHVFIATDFRNPNIYTLPIHDFLEPEAISQKDKHTAIDLGDLLKRLEAVEQVVFSSMQKPTRKEPVKQTEQPKAERWRARYDETYHYLNSKLTDVSEQDTLFDEDLTRYQIGNYFQTKEQAISASKVISATFQNLELVEQFLKEQGKL